MWHLSSAVHFVYLPAQQTRGGILLAWRDGSFSVDHHFLHHHSVSVLLSRNDEPAWWLTGVYGPVIDGKPVTKMLVDGGVAVNIMSYAMLRKLGKSNEDLTKMDMMLKDFEGGIPFICLVSADKALFLWACLS